MAAADSSSEHRIPRGGPIYLTDLVGSITRVPDFETSVFEELNSLIAELNTECDEEEDLLVDELKIFSEEELVDKALKEAFPVEECSTQEAAVATASTVNTSDKAEAAKDAAAASNGTTVEMEKNLKNNTSDRDIRASRRREKNSYFQQGETQPQVLQVVLYEATKSTTACLESKCSNEILVELDGDDKLEKPASKRNKRGRASVRETRASAQTEMESQPQVQQVVPYEAGTTACLESNISAMNECSNGTIVIRDGEDKLDKTAKKSKKRGRASDRETRAAQLEKNKEAFEEMESQPHGQEEFLDKALKKTTTSLESNNSGSNGTIIIRDVEDKLEKNTEKRYKRGTTSDRETRAAHREKNKQVFEIDAQMGMGSQPHVQEEALDEATKNTTVGLDSSNLVLNKCSNGTIEKKTTTKRKKRGRTYDRETRAAQLENTSYIEKVEKLAKIKQKQEEDKIAARLHSFNSGCKANEGALTLSRADQLKLRSLNFITSSGKMRRPPVVEHVPISYPEVVLCVEIWNMTKTVKSQELLVLGSQMLTVLRDQIYCSTDQLMQKAGKHDPSGYFLIEDMFCNDKRDPSAIDYSEPIFEWLRKSKDEVREKWEAILSGELQHKQRAVFGNTNTLHTPQFKAVEMHKIRFCDLWFKLRAGYLYCHQGDCKHFIVIRDMRLIHPEDVQNRAAYPVSTFQHKHRYRKCSVCKIYQATKVTVDDKWAQENPCYFCDNCYYLLHYKQDGSLLYPDFTVYDYHHE